MEKKESRRKDMKKIIVDKNKCIGCGACEGFEPDVFELNDEGLAEAIKENYDELDTEVKENVDDAAANCPTSAIKVSE